MRENFLEPERAIAPSIAIELMTSTHSCAESLASTISHLRFRFGVMTTNCLALTLRPI